jgi:hypothetical protein
LSDRRVDLTRPPVEQSRRSTSMWTTLDSYSFVRKQEYSNIFSRCFE